MILISEFTRRISPKQWIAILDSRISIKYLLIIQKKPISEDNMW